MGPRIAIFYRIVSCRTLQRCGCQSCRPRISAPLLVLRTTPPQDTVGAKAYNIQFTILAPAYSPSKRFWKTSWVRLKVAANNWRLRPAAGLSFSERNGTTTQPRRSCGGMPPAAFRSPQTARTISAIPCPRYQTSLTTHENGGSSACAPTAKTFRGRRCGSCTTKTTTSSFPGTCTTSACSLTTRSCRMPGPAWCGSTTSY